MKKNYTHAQSGVTLVEAIIAVAVLAVLATITLPSLREATQKYRALAAASGFAGDLRFARSEAQRRGVPVTVCASGNGTTCTNSTTWQIGWIVFADPPAAQNVTTPLRVATGFSGAESLVADNSASAITFGRDGFVQLPAGTTQITFSLIPMPANDDAMQCIEMSAAGRIHVRAGVSGACRSG